MNPKTGEFMNEAEDLAELARLAAIGAQEDIRLFLAKLVRRYRSSDPVLAARLDDALKRTAAVSGRGTSVLRGDVGGTLPSQPMPPVDRDSRLSLVRTFDDRDGIEPPLLPADVLSQLEAVVAERRNVELLERRGLRATKSLAFVGPPGVGKTLSARWLAAQLAKPLWVLDLTAVMSSLLGRTGHNLRSVFDYAREQEAILLLDEFDAIAKRRGDDSDVGEIKRVVTVMLQEIEDWSSKSMLIAATNHQEMVDPALWRRFDAVVHFPNPTQHSIAAAIRRFMGADAEAFGGLVDPMAWIFSGQTLSDVERAIGQLRRRLALNAITPREALQALLDERIPPLKKSERLQLAIAWAQSGVFSHSEINEITGVSRDTIRKHAGPANRVGRRRRK
ncbi:MAG: ATP-binding protein [Xanthomonadaceae bacterium]|nr:ATP-binding protein [Xanthomonadaceae bacterium]